MASTPYVYEANDFGLRIANGQSRSVSSAHNCGYVVCPKRHGMAGVAGVACLG